MKRTKFIALVAACLVGGMVCADNYYPEGYHPEGTACSVAYSSATSFRADASNAKTTPSALEARFRSWARSLGAGIDLLKEFGTRIIFR